MAIVNAKPESTVGTPARGYDSQLETRPFVRHIASCIHRPVGLYDAKNCTSVAPLMGTFEWPVLWTLPIVELSIPSTSWLQQMEEGSSERSESPMAQASSQSFA